MDKFLNVTMPRIMDENQKAGFFFFSTDTMKCFNSQVPGQTPVPAEYSDDLYFFVTSEQFKASDGTRFPRRWHVRTFRPSSGDCGSGAGTDFGTKAKALAAIRSFARGEFEAGYLCALPNSGCTFFANEWSSINQEYVEYKENQ